MYVLGIDNFKIMKKRSIAELCILTHTKNMALFCARSRTDGVKITNE